MSVLTLGALAVLALSGSAAPNVLVLFADDLGLNQLAVPHQPYGFTGVSGAIKTPNIAQLAAEGTVFMQWYSAFHVCTPSRGGGLLCYCPGSQHWSYCAAAMMTGRLPVRVGLGDGVLSASAKGGLQTNETTMAEALGALGYETAMFGK